MFGSSYQAIVSETPNAPRAPVNSGRLALLHLPTFFVFAAFLLLVAIIQRSASAPAAAFGSFPDESAHYVAGMMTHDYLAHSLGRNPIHFVREYYLHRPFFALGVWPPFFYLMEGCWMSLFGAQRESLLWMMAVAGAGLATLVYWILRKEYDHWTGVAGGTLLLLIPVVQWSVCLVMVDLSCSLFALASLVFFARFVERQRWQDSLLFGLFSGMALLTKNSTYFVLLVPPIVIAAARRWDLLRNPRIWIAPVAVTAMYLPWFLVSRSVLLLGIRGLELPGFLGIHRDFIATLWQEMSFLLPLAALGVVALIASKRKRSAISLCMLAVLPALPLGIFVARVPVQDRLLMLAYAAVILLVAEAWTVVWPAKRAVMMMACVAVFATISWMQFRKPQANDIRSAVAFLDARDGNQRGAALVPSEREGPWIAEFAENEAKGPLRTMVRPTKMFGEEDWNGSNWTPYYRNAEEMKRFLEKMPVKYCIFSKSPGGRRYLHDALLEEVVAENSQSWKLVFAHKTEDGPELRIYENLRWDPNSEYMVLTEVRRVLERFLDNGRQQTETSRHL